MNLSLFLTFAVEDCFGQDTAQSVDHVETVLYVLHILYMLQFLN